MEIKSTKQSLILSSIYGYPTSDVILFQDKLRKVLLKLESKKTIYGDIIINLLNTKNNEVKNYTNMLTPVGCNLLINSLTRYFNNFTPSHLDYFYTNKTHQKASKFVIDYNDIIPA